VCGECFGDFLFGGVVEVGYDLVELVAWVVGVVLGL